jgi:hypothetical protein
VKNLPGVYVSYERGDGTEAIHITDMHPSLRTLCGKSTEGRPFLDETMAGIAATCETCKRIIKQQRESA